MTNTTMKYFKDVFNIPKYKRRINTLENSYKALNEKYVEKLELIPSLVVKLENYENQIKNLKKDVKELKRIIEEDMTPKKKRKVK